MEKFSVKKPFTILVAVIAVLVLGVVSYLKMTPDLLPNMDFPYMIITTAYPGASPEKVESEVTKPLEQAMATLEHIKEITSTSSENYSMVVLEFETEANLDILGVDIQQKLGPLSDSWDDMIATPYVLKINPSMLPVEVAGVSMEGMDVKELTQFLDKELMPKLEGIAGVASVTSSGVVSQQLHVVLDQEKLDVLNKTIADTINGKMDTALQELNKAKEEMESAQAQLNAGKDALQSGKETLQQQTAGAEAELNYQQGQLIATKAQMYSQLSQLQSGKTQLESTLSVLKALKSAIDTISGEIAALQGDLHQLLQMQQTGAELTTAREVFEKQIAALENSGLSPESLEAAVNEIKNSPQYLQMEAQWAALEAQLSARGTTWEDIETFIAEKQAVIDRLLERLEGLKGALQEQGLTLESLDGAITEMQDNLAMMDTGIDAINQGMSQLDQGLLQLKDAATLLSEQKSAGLLELAAASTELAVGQASITAAMPQIEEGINTLENTRKDTLSQTDIHTIITMDTVSAILTAQNFAMPAGYVEQDGVSYMVSVGQEITRNEEVENLLLFDMGMDGVAPIHLKDVAQIMVTDNSAEVYTKLNGSAGIVLSFEKQSTYATAETTDNITKRFEDLEAEYPGLEFVTLMDQGSYIYMIVETILSSLILGALFSIVVLYLFLRDLRPTFITLCSIPLSVIFAIVLMYFSGVTLNMISLSGLAVAVGMLVDNSVVVIENIYRLRSKGATVVQASISGAKQVAGAVTASTLTTVCVFLPIVFVEGITKQLFTDLALTLTYALLASLLVSLTLVPAMASGLLRKEKKQSHKVMDKFLEIYGKAASWSLDHKAVVLGVSTGLLVLTAAISISKGFIFMPEMDMPNVNVTLTIPDDTSLEKAAVITDTVLQKIDTLEGIDTVGAMMDENQNVTIYITLEDENASGAKVGKQILDLCQDVPCEITASSAMMDMSMLTGSGVALEIYANDMQSLQSAAELAGKTLSQVEGVLEVSDGLEDATPALHIQIDRNKAMAKGITIAQIYMELAKALPNETTAATLNLDGTATEVIIEKPQAQQLTVEDLKNYVFEVESVTKEKKTFTLAEVAQVVETVSLQSISRLSQQRYLTVTATLEEGANVTLVTRAAEKVLKSVDLGKDVTYAFAGENEMIMESVEQMILMLGLGILLVYLVMVAQFQSLKSPFIVMFTIPLAFTGGFAGLLLCGMEVSVISLVGFVMLTGIIVNNGIVLVDYINQLRLEGMQRREAILEAGKTRMRPILMTSITTILGLTDMAVNKTAGTTLMQPVAVVCIGGLIYATLMTLFVVPCIYEMMNKKELRKIDQADLEYLDL